MGIAASARHNLRSEPMKIKIYRLIRDEILVGNYPLGSQLSEPSIAEDLGVSRTPVREALLILQNEGLVAIRPQSGTYVFSPSAEDVNNVCEMRITLESAALVKAIKTDDPQLVTRLRRLVEQAEEMLVGDLEESHKLDTRFHASIIEADNNPFMSQSYTTVANRMHALRQLLPLTRKRLGKASGDHIAIIDALENKDQGTAISLIEQHVIDVQKMLLQALEKKSDS